MLGSMQALYFLVILLVRMWVEISLPRLAKGGTLSSSSWGCELKFKEQGYLTISGERHPPREDVSWNVSSFKLCGGEIVILLVRMWVEIAHAPYCALFIRSSSSWGCELKYVYRAGRAAGNQSSSSWGCELKLPNLLSKLILPCHPPREDVSWNPIKS